MSETPGSTPARTIVVADPHATPELFLGVLEHSGYDREADRLIVAGDLLDIGPDPKGLLDAVQEFGAEVLLGNHEQAAMTGHEISEASPQSPQFAPLLREKVMGREWKIAAAVGDILVTHAGVGIGYTPEFEAAGSDLTRFAEWLNDEFVADLELFEKDGFVEQKSWSMLAPLRWRPRMSAPLPVRQIFGHTPPSAIVDLSGLESRGIFAIDPDVRPHDYFGAPLRMRYAVVDAAGIVSVIDQELHVTGSVEARPPAVSFWDLDLPIDGA